MKFSTKALLSVALVFMALATQAQLKVGSNPTTISSGVNLEVEADNSNKTIFNKTNGFVGIGWIPSDQLTVYGAIHLFGKGTVDVDGLHMVWNDPRLSNSVQTHNLASVGFLNNSGSSGLGGFTFATTTDDINIRHLLELKWDGNMVQRATGYLRIASGTTAQRPQSLVTNNAFEVLQEGMLRYNTEIDRLEYYNGTMWKLVATTN